MATWQTQAKNVAMTIAVLSGIVMALTLGIGEAASVVLGHQRPKRPS